MVPVPEICGPVCTATVLVAVALVPWLVEPSLTTQLMVRDPAVVALVLKVTESSSAW